MTFKGDDPVGKVTTSLKSSKPGLSGGSIHRHVGSCQERADGPGDPGGGIFVPSAQDPHDLAKRWKRQGNQFGIGQGYVRRFSLPNIITNESADKEICVCCDFQPRSAQPFAAASVISSSVRVGPSARLSRLNTAEMSPLWGARTSIRPSGNFSTLIWSPGPTPR